MCNLSVVIITKNEEHNIERCLKSVRWADEIVVVDSGSLDRTVEICRQFKCNIITSEWIGFGKTKQIGVDSATHQWILSLDADEEVTEPLHHRIQEILKKPDYSGYRIKRCSFYLDRMIRTSGWNRDHPLRLFDRNYGRFNDKVVHESVSLSGQSGRIEEPIYHYTYPTIRSHIERMNRYSGLGADQLASEGRKTTIFSAVLRGFLKFLRMYILQGGFLDGKNGFLLAFNSGFGTYLKYIKLWEMNR